MTPGVDVVVVVPEPLGWIAGCAIIAAAVGCLVVSIYNSRAILENWDQVQDDADLGARGVGRLTEHLTDLREEMTAAMLDHCERLDGIDDRLAAPPPMLPVATVEAEAIDTGARKLFALAATAKQPAPEQRPTPHKRARTTEPTRTETAP